MRDQNLCVSRQKNVSLFVDGGTISCCLLLCELFELAPSSEASKGEYGSSWIASARAIPEDLEDHKQAISKHNLLPATRLLLAPSARGSCRLLSKELSAPKADVSTPAPSSSGSLFAPEQRSDSQLPELFPNTSGRLGEIELLSQGIPSQLASEIKLFPHGPICAQGEDGRRHK